MKQLCMYQTPGVRVEQCDLSISKGVIGNINHFLYNNEAIHTLFMSISSYDLCLALVEPSG